MCLRVLKTITVAEEHMTSYFTYTIASIQVNYVNCDKCLSAYLSDQIERVQRKVLRSLFPEVSYSKALEDAGLKTLFHRREEHSV